MGKQKKRGGIWANQKKRAIFARNLLIITFNLQGLEKQTIPRGKEKWPKVAVHLKDILLALCLWNGLEQINHRSKKD
jgi:hypothetical protein